MCEKLNIEIDILKNLSHIVGGRVKQKCPTNIDSLELFPVSCICRSFVMDVISPVIYFNFIQCKINSKM